MINKPNASIKKPQSLISQLFGKIQSRAPPSIVTNIQLLSLSSSIRVHQPAPVPWITSPPRRRINTPSAARENENRRLESNQLLTPRVTVSTSSLPAGITEINPVVALTIRSNCNAAGAGLASRDSESFIVGRGKKSCCAGDGQVRWWDRWKSIARRISERARNRNRASCVPEALQSAQPHNELPLFVRAGAAASGGA